MSTASKNTTPLTFEEFKERKKSNVHQLKNYYSLYITPKGQIFDCGYPEALCHNGFCANVYENLDELPEELFNSCLRGLDVPFEEIPYYIMDYHNLLDIMYADADLYTTVYKILLGSEDKICQDMGFVKVAINEKMHTCEVVIPNSIFNKQVTAHQKEIIKNLSELFNLDIDIKLKREQRANAEISMNVVSALQRIKRN